MNCVICKSWVFYEYEDFDSHAVCISGHRIVQNPLAPLPLLGNESGPRYDRRRNGRPPKELSALRRRIRGKHDPAQQTAGA